MPIVERGSDLRLDPRRGRAGKHFEYQFEAGTAGGQDGVGRAWRDGQLVIERPDLPYFAEGADAHWRGVWMDPTWGGLNDQLDASQYILFRDLYVSFGK